MKILHVVHCLPPDGTGGIQTCVLSIAPEQARRHDVSILTFTQRPLEGAMQVEQLGAVRVIRLPWPPRQGHGLDGCFPELESAFEQAAMSLRPDIIHLHELHDLSAKLVAVSKAVGARVVVTLHDYLIICPTYTIDYRGELCYSPGKKCYSCLHPDEWSRRRLLPYWKITNSILIALGSALPKSRLGQYLRLLENRKAIYFSAVREADGVIAVSRAQAQVFEDAGLDRELRIIPHGICPPRAASRRREVHKTLRFGFIGHHIVKGLEMLLEVFAEGELDAELWVYTDVTRFPRPYRDRVKRLIRRDNIRVLGEFTSEQIDDVFSSIDILVAPSLWVEPFGLVAAEAVARGVPVIAADSSGFEETVRHEVNGILFRRGDKHSLKQAMKRFLDEPDLLERLRANCTVVRTTEDEAREIEDLYLELLGLAVGEREDRQCRR